jgi:hypothetical protein
MTFRGLTGCDRYSRPPVCPRGAVEGQPRLQNAPSGWSIGLRRSSSDGRRGLLVLIGPRSS